MMAERKALWATSVIMHNSTLAWRARHHWFPKKQFKMWTPQATKLYLRLSLWVSVMSTVFLIYYSFSFQFWWTWTCLNPRYDCFCTQIHTAGKIGPNLTFLLLYDPFLTFLMRAWAAATQLFQVRPRPVSHLVQNRMHIWCFPRDISLNGHVSFIRLSYNVLNRYWKLSPAVIVATV